MKGEQTFQHLIRVLHKSGKLNDADSHGLTIAVTRLQHALHIGDRRNAIKHFEILCKLISDMF